ncbi:MAG: hypothetical protein HZC36_06245, partial [Armatimonadetes bacterium]|nr:hypothetical protein [Armatimonadota bacterium]
MLYEKDFDDRLMDRDSWMDQLAPYVKNEPSNHCTVVAKENEENPSLYGFSFNSRLHQIDTNKITDPEARPMLYDSNNLARNASDPFNSLPDPGRHGTKELPKNVVAFADAHAIALSKEKAKEFKP